MLSAVGDFFFKKIELWVVIMIIIIGAFLAVFTAYFAQKKAIGDNSAGIVGRVAFGVSRIPELVESALVEASGNLEKFETPDPKHWALLNQIDYPKQLSGYITQSNEKGDKFDLIRLSDGSIFKSWVNLPYRPRAVSLHDNTVLLGGFAGAQDSSRTIDKYNQEGEQLWSKTIPIHHTVHVDSNGFIYTPIIMPTHEYVQSLMPAGGVYRDDGYAVLDPDGNILDSQSVTQILIDNDLGHLLFGVGALEKDGVHLNSVKAADIESEYWEIGDLLMSARHLSLVFLYRPSTGKIVWHQTGPWLNQHDPDFISSTEISVFGNDMVSTYFNRVAEDAQYRDGGNNIYVHDFATQETTIRYRDFMDEVGLATVTSGTHHIFEDGSLFVWFSNTGISTLYDKTSETVSYFAQKYDDSRVNRQQAIWFYPE